jgi:hypothetical protein
MFEVVHTTECAAAVRLRLIAPPGECRTSALLLGEGRYELAFCEFLIVRRDLT